MSELSPGHLTALLSPPPPPVIVPEDDGDDYKQADVAIVRSNGQVVLVYRRVEPRRGKPCAPGGFRRKREPGNVAAARELFEEAGIRLAPYRFAFLWQYYVEGPGITLRFWIADWDDNLDGPLPPFEANEESSARILADPHNLPDDMAFESHVTAIHMAFGLS